MTEMLHALSISVRLYEGRFHGEGDEPPSPARLFQSLVAVAGLGGPLCPADQSALRWLEGLDPPVIASPKLTRGQGFRNYLPGNDLDAVSGDLRRIGKVRDHKHIRPLLFDADVPFVYAWTFEPSEFSKRHSNVIRDLAEGLYQFGRGVDMAWAWHEEIAAADLDQRLASWAGVVYRPTLGGLGTGLRCPGRGTLDSLVRRHEASATRFQPVVSERDVVIAFSKPPQGSFETVPYDSPPARYLYELRERGSSARLFSWPLDEPTKLVEKLRNAVEQRMRRTLPAERAEDIDRFLVGHQGSRDRGPPTSRRVRIIPLPSIGHRHVDYGIRRVLVEVPQGCSLEANVVERCFSGLELDRSDRASIDVTPAAASTMLEHYGVHHLHRAWRSVTPVVLPESARRRRIDPARAAEGGKTGAERRAEQERAATAVSQALRHAKLRCQPTQVRVQREPFEPNGQRVEPFAEGTRFPKERLWHVELRFTDPVQGILVIGDGRFLGLGLMQPVETPHGVVAFHLERRIDQKHRLTLVHHLRRALMSLARNDTGQVARLFSGHEPAGQPDSQEHHSHLFLAADDTASSDGSDGSITRLVVAAPWAVGRSVKRDDSRRFDEVIGRLTELRAGRLGRFDHLTAQPVEDGDPLIGPASIWTGKTPYVATRNVKKRDNSTEFVKADIATECVRRGLPRPKEIDIADLHVGPKGGRPTAKLTLRFAVAVRGPLLLGRDSHFGGGLFHAVRRT